MKKFLERFKQLNKTNGKKGSALVTVICVTSVALVLIMSLASLANYALDKTIVEITEQTAVYNAESIAKMISDDLTTTGKSKYTPTLKTLAKAGFVKCELHHDKLGYTLVEFKREPNRPKNIIMNVTNTVAGHTGLVSVRFRLGQENNAVLEEVKKIFKNTVYSGSFPSGAGGSLHNVDFGEGDIVVKLDKDGNLQGGNDGQYIKFGENEEGENEVDGNLTVVFNNPEKNELKLSGQMEIEKNLIIDGNADIGSAVEIEGRIIATGNITIGVNSGQAGGSLEIGDDDTKKSIGIMAGKNLTLNIDSKEIIRGDVYVGGKLNVQNAYRQEGKLYLKGTAEKCINSWQSQEILFRENENSEWESLYDNNNKIKEAVKEKYIVENYKFNKTGEDGGWKEGIQEKIEEQYSDSPVPVWYAPDDSLEKRENGGWTNFYDNAGIIETKYGVDMGKDITISTYNYTWTSKGVKDVETKVNTIASSGKLNQKIINDATNKAAGKQPQRNNLLSAKHQTVIFDTTKGNLHIKLSENVKFEDTDVVILGKNYIYLYTEQYRIDIGKNQDNKDIIKSNTLDSFIHFGVSVRNNTRKYNLSGKNNEYESLEKSLRPQMFIISSYTEEEVEKIDKTLGVKKGSKNIYPFVCVNNSAVLHAYLYAPYRPVIMSEGPQQDGCKLVRVENPMYKFMGSMCVSRVDDYKDAKQSLQLDDALYGINLFATNNEKSARKLQYFNPPEAALKSIYMNSQSLIGGENQEGSESSQDKKPANPTNDVWVLEEFLAL